VPALAVVASAIGCTRVIWLREGWYEPCVVWSAIVGTSGSRRTAAFRRAVWWPFRQQKSQLMVYRALVRRYRLEMRRMEDAGRRAEEDFAGPGSQLPERPVLDRPVCVDTAVETPAEILEDNKRGILVARADFDSWLLPLTHHRRRDVGRDVAAWSEVFLAGMLCIDGGAKVSGFTSSAALPSVSQACCGRTRSAASLPPTSEAGRVAELVRPGAAEGVPQPNRSPFAGISPGSRFSRKVLRRRGLSSVWDRPTR
jgi:hypothetical protein